MPSSETRRSDDILLAALVTIVVVLVCMLEVGKRAEARVAAPATAPAVQAPAAVAATPSPT